MHDARPGADSVRTDLVGIAARARARLLRATALPRVLGHADREAQNPRRQGEQPYAVHDWDSLARLTEAAPAGAACGAFASTDIPTLAPLASPEAFLAAYQAERGPFGAEEREVVWAAGLWPALHDARAEILRGHPHTALTRVLAQAPARLHRAAP